MHEEERAFLKEIAEHPEDDFPRLVFADWLEERGEPRGEFIRLQCERASLQILDPRYQELRLKETSLLGQYGQDWFTPTRAAGFRDVTFVKGFVGAATLRATEFLNRGEALFKAAPLLQSVWLKSAKTVWQQLLHSDLLNRLVELNLSVNCLDDQDLLLLNSHPVPKRLRNLIWDGNLPLNDSNFVLTDSPWLRQLHRLSLKSMLLRDSGLERLCQQKNLKLQSLSLAGNGLSSYGLSILADAPWLSGLEELDLSYNSLENDPIVHLAESPYLSQLRILNLEQNELTGRILKHLGEQPALAQLEHLRFGGHIVHSHEVLPLLDPHCFPKLKTLDLRRPDTFVYQNGVRRRLPGINVATGKQLEERFGAGVYY